MTRLFFAAGPLLTSALLALAASCAPPVPGDVGEGEGEGAGGEGEGEAPVGEGEGEAPVGEGEGEAPVGEGEGEAPVGEGEGEGDAGEGEGEGDVGAGFGPYDVDGDEVVETLELAVETDTGSRFNLLTFVPSSPGPHPVVSISPGLSQPAVAYTSFGLRLASHGFVVVARNDPGPFGASTPEVTADLVYVVDTWLAEQNDDAGGPLGGRLDLTRVGLAGHSRGGKASLLAAEGELQGDVLGWFGLDPVDATAGGDTSQAVTEIENVGIPLAFLGAGVTSSCAPAESNYAVLFEAAVSPAVQIVGIGAGHTQFEDAENCFFCGFCSPAGTADPDVVLDYAVRYLMAFFARELQGDDGVGAGFAGAGIAADVAAGRVTVAVK